MKVDYIVGIDVSITRDMRELNMKKKKKEDI